MERNLEARGESKKTNLKKENINNVDNTFDNDKKLEEGIHSDYLNDLDFQINLEEEIMEEFSKTKNDSLRESLLEIRKSGEESLKTISSKIIEVFSSNKLAVLLRNSYIEKRGHKIYKELSVDNKLAQAEDYDSFLKTISSDFWGSLVNSDDAIYRANIALTSIASNFTQKHELQKEGVDLDGKNFSKAQNVLSVWPKLLSKHDSHARTSRNLDNYLNRVVANSGTYCDEAKENLKKFISSENDFIALQALTLTSIDHAEKDFPGEILSRIDSVISEFPDARALPDNIKSLLLNFVSKKPEEFLLNNRRADFLFNIWLNDLKRQPDNGFKAIMPVLIERISNCSENETKEILRVIDIHRAHSYSSEDLGWLLSVLPIEKNDLKPFIKKIDEGLVGGHIVAVKEAELSGLKISTENFNDILEAARRLSSGEELIFLSSLIIKYPDENSGINSEMLGQVLDSLKSGGENRFSIEKIHALSILMNKNNWPDILKEKVFSLIDISKDINLKILDNKDAENYAWINSEPSLVRVLQINFHKKAGQNELRHYFYEVLDGKRESDDIDDLIKSYGNSQTRLDFEEIRSLFLDGKIDKKYIEYFIDKVYVRDILCGLENNSINPEDEKFLLESALKYGQAKKTLLILEKVFSLEAYQSPEKRREMIDLMSGNLVSEVNERKHYYESVWVRNIADDIFRDNGYYNGKYSYQKTFLSDDEIKYLGRKVMEDALGMSMDNRLANLVLTYPEMIRTYFPDMNKDNEPVNDREEYLTKLFERLAPNGQNESYSIITEAYFSGLDLDIHDENTRLKIENKFLELRALKHTDFIDNFYYLNDEQSEKFLNYFTENNSVDPNDNSVNNTCHRLSVKQAESITNNKEGLKRVYIKLLNDKNLQSSHATILFKEDVVFGDEDIRKAFFSNINNWPEVDGTEILEAAAKRKNEEGFSLNLDEVKTISTAVMNHRGLSPRFWNNYLASGAENNDFYLDGNLFEMGLKNIGEDCFSEKAENVVSFLKSIESSEFEVKNEDIEKIIVSSFNGNSNKRESNFSERLEIFYAYRPDLIEKEIIEKKFEVFQQVFESNIDYSENFKDGAIKKLFENKLYRIEVFLDYLKKKNDQVSLNKFKEFVNREVDKDYAMSARLQLLQHDFLNVEESKKLYKESTSNSKDNVRGQILNSIDIISSMLSNRDNIDKLSDFFDEPNLERAEGLKEIADFIEKYSKENKGRSIAVMLFAREYLPDRKIEEVIERVSHSLRKYQEVLDKNSYGKIPEGLHASIGMEYEITQSTADGYQELTQQSSLKKDIARLSNAARIGSGRDAVHEIATKPTDNPYLMLLEMKLLHDIEYIDLNFDRSENYQKGARGFHLTIGGEKGIAVNQESNFLQNAIITASWGGVQSGESGHKVNGGRGISLRGRSRDDSNNIKFFDEATDSVELRSLSIDKFETLQRAVTTAFNGAIAIQAFRECFSRGSEKALEMLSDETESKNLQEMINSKDEKTGQLANSWLELISKVDKAIKNHNDSFLDRETYGYLDDEGIWVDPADFGGEYNKKRFDSIITNIDPTLSLDEYAKTTEINRGEMFKSFSVDLSDKLIKINNLYLKPGATSLDNKENKTSVFKGDHTNSISMLKVTKLDNDRLEYYDDDFLNKTVFDTAGEKRTGYYAIQGGSELMLTHAVQKSLIEFNSKIEKLLN